MSARSGRHNIALLIIAQILAQTASIAMVAISALVAFDMASDKGLATLPIALVMVAGAALMIPASLFMQRRGRRAGFMLGALAGVISALLAALAVWKHSFALFVAAHVCFGAYTAFAQYYRFAAVEAADLAHRARAISWVVSGGIVAAITGPWLARGAGQGGSDTFLRAFLALAVLAVLAVLVLSRLRLPLPALPVAGAAIRPLRAIVTQPVFLTALAASVAGFGVMSTIMSATPLAMQLCGLPLAAATGVIQWHMLGMFVPSLFVGELIRRIGLLPVMVGGALLMGAAILVATRGPELAYFYIALTLLGVGWNFLFIGGSTLLTQVWQPGEQAKVQACHDFVVFGVASFGSYSSGRVLDASGWNSVNTYTLPLLLLAAVMIVIHWRTRAPAEL